MARHKRILHYIKGLPDFGLKFESINKKKADLHCYSDADWAGDRTTRKSITGYGFKLAGGTVSWKTKKQSVVALLFREVEYIALCSAIQEAVWLRRLLKSITFIQPEPTMIYEDNHGAIALSKNAKNHTQTKHIDIKYHYVRETIMKKDIQLKYCPTENQVVDIWTKGLAKQRFEELNSMIGVC